MDNTPKPPIHRYVTQQNDMIITVDHYDYNDQKVIHSVKIVYNPPRIIDNGDSSVIMANIKDIFEPISEVTECVESTSTPKR